MSYLSFVAVEQSIDNIEEDITTITQWFGMDDNIRSFPME